MRVFARFSAEELESGTIGLRCRAVGSHFENCGTGHDRESRPAIRLVWQRYEIADSKASRALGKTLAVPLGQILRIEIGYRHDFTGFRVDVRGPVVIGKIHRVDLRDALHDRSPSLPALDARQTEEDDDRVTELGHLVVGQTADAAAVISKYSIPARIYLLCGTSRCGDRYPRTATSTETTRTEFLEGTSLRSP
jgi:hypothetical protein